MEMAVESGSDSGDKPMLQDAAEPLINAMDGTQHTRIFAEIYFVS